MLQNLPIILSGNSFFTHLKIIPYLPIIPEICARYKHINYGVTAILELWA